MTLNDRSSVLEDFGKSLKYGQKVTGAVPTSAINSEQFANPQEIENAKVSIGNLKTAKSSDEAGILRLEKVIKDRTKFIRLYITKETVNAFQRLNSIASFKLLAWIVDSLSDSDDNSIVFDQEFREYYNLTRKTFRTAVKDLQKCEFLMSAELHGGEYQYIKSTYKYFVNPAIFQAGKINEDALKCESKVRKRFDMVITDEDKIISKANVRKSCVDALCSYFFLPIDKSFEKKGVKITNGVYVSSEREDLPPFFKVFRGAFSNALLALEHKCSAKIISFVIDTYRPKDKDLTNISRTNVTTNTLGDKPISKSTYYRAIGDLLRSGIIYRDKTNKKYYINPSCWYNGSAYNLLKSCKATEDTSEKFMTKKEKKRRRFAKYQNAILYNQLTQQSYNNA